MTSVPEDSVCAGDMSSRRPPCFQSEECLSSLSCTRSSSTPSPQAPEHFLQPRPCSSILNTQKTGESQKGQGLCSNLLIQSGSVKESQQDKGQPQKRQQDWMCLYCSAWLGGSRINVWLPKLDLGWDEGQGNEGVLQEATCARHGGARL